MVFLSFRVPCGRAFSFVRCREGEVVVIYSVFILGLRRLDYQWFYVRGLFVVWYFSFFGGVSTVVRQTLPPPDISVMKVNVKDGTLCLSDHYG